MGSTHCDDKAEPKGGKLSGVRSIGDRPRFAFDDESSANIGPERRRYRVMGILRANTGR